MIRPKTIDEALAAHASGAVYAGGMTLIMLDRAAGKPQPALIDLAGIAGLHGIRSTDQGLTIGAMTTLEAMRSDPLVVARFPAIADLLGSVGSLALRHQATLGGNLAWGHGDLIVPLLALGATVATAQDRLPLASQPADALILATDLPLSAARLQVEKVGFRGAFSPTLATVAACFDRGAIRLAAGGGPTKATRLVRAEALVERAEGIAARMDRPAFVKAVVADAAWGSDVLADGAYRADVAARLLFALLKTGDGRHG